MHSWAWMVIVVYGMAMLFIFAYSIMQLSLLVRYKRFRKPTDDKGSIEGEWPEVLIQLPVYNEYYVVSRLIDAVAQLDYPKDKLSIQVLDDSSDESFEIAAKRIAYWSEKGIAITHVKRPERIGFKAGALQYGLGLNSAPFVAIFDADFIPGVDFLKSTIPHLSEESIGMVQTRWGHLNRDYSLLTKVQAFALDAHFTVEQLGRNLGKHFMNFNGTAGVWRRTCIDDAGGWNADTLTEDLDLSYRAQLKGWRFKFLEDVVSPAELPAEMRALKNQQYRWNKGAAECAVKHVPNVFQKEKIPFSTRLHALFHLLNSSVFLWIMVCAVLSFPLVFIKSSNPSYQAVFFAGSILIFSFFILAAMYFSAFRKVAPKANFFSFVWMYAAFLSISMGMSLHNARAAIQGYFGKRTPFVRTPKWNLVGQTGGLSNKRYVSEKIPVITWFEGAFGLYFLLALIYDLSIGEWGFVLMHLMLFFGFTFVFTFSLRQSAVKR